MTKANMKKALIHFLKDYPDITVDTKINFKKVRGAEAYSVFFRSKTLENKTLREVMLQKEKAPFVIALKKEFRRVEPEGGCADMGASFIIGE